MKQSAIRTFKQVFVIWLFLYAVSLSSSAADTLTWLQCLQQEPEWYGSEEAVRVADQVLLYQGLMGGWPKNTDMARPLSEQEKKDLAEEIEKAQVEMTIDNGATYSQMLYLAKVYEETKLDRFKDSFYRGLNYLLEAQYENGGWPMVYPIRTGAYWHYITFNDNSMSNVMRILLKISLGKEPYAFVDAQWRTRADKAVAKGIECILKCQIVVDGKKTAWCAQHDEKTLEPREGRPYERPSISGAESVDIVDFLMEIENPSPEVIESVQAAVAWLDHVKLTGIRQITQPQESGPCASMAKLLYTREEAEQELGLDAADLERYVTHGALREIRDLSNQLEYKIERDKVIIQDHHAPPLWARFYQIGTNQPIFCSRDGIIKYNLADISYERRNAYVWYIKEPADLLTRTYPEWQKKHTLICSQD